VWRRSCPRQMKIDFRQGRASCLARMNRINDGDVAVGDPISSAGRVGYVKARYCWYEEALAYSWPVEYHADCGAASMQFKRRVVPQGSLDILDAGSCGQ